MLLIGFYFRTGEVCECTAEEAAYRNVLQHMQYIGMYCRTGSIFEYTAD